MLTVYIHVLASTHIPFHKLQSLSLLNALHIQRYWRALSSNTHVPPFLHVALPQGWGSTYSCCQRKHRNSFVKFHRKISRSHFELIAYFTARVQKKKKKWNSFLLSVIDFVTSRRVKRWSVRSLPSIELFWDREHDAWRSSFSTEIFCSSCLIWCLYLVFSAGYSMIYSPERNWESCVEI